MWCVGWRHQVTQSYAEGVGPFFTLEFRAPPFARLKIAHFTRKLTYLNENLQSKWKGFLVAITAVFKIWPIFRLGNQVGQLQLVFWKLFIKSAHIMTVSTSKENLT